MAACRFLLLLFILSFFKYSHAAVANYRLCFDRRCQIAISKGYTVGKYASIHADVMSFITGKEVLIYCKSAGIKMDLWCGTIDGKWGYFPKTLVQEHYIFQGKLYYWVPTKVPIDDTLVKDYTEGYNPNYEVKTDSSKPVENKMPAEVVNPLELTKPQIKDDTSINMQTKDGTIIPQQTKEEVITPKYNKDEMSDLNKILEDTYSSVENIPLSEASRNSPKESDEKRLKQVEIISDKIYTNSISQDATMDHDIINSTENQKTTETPDVTNNHNVMLDSMVNSTINFDEKITDSSSDATVGNQNALSEESKEELLEDSANYKTDVSNKISPDNEDLLEVADDHLPPSDKTSVDSDVSANTLEDKDDTPVEDSEIHNENVNEEALDLSSDDEMQSLINNGFLIKNENIAPSEESVKKETFFPDKSDKIESSVLEEPEKLKPSEKIDLPENSDNKEAFSPDELDISKPISQEVTPTSDTIINDTFYSEELGKNITENEIEKSSGTNLDALKVEEIQLHHVSDKESSPDYSKTSDYTGDSLLTTDSDKLHNIEESVISSTISSEIILNTDVKPSQVLFDGTLIPVDIVDDIIPTAVVMHTTIDEEASVEKPSLFVNGVDNLVQEAIITSRKDNELKSSIDINTPNEVDNLERERVDTGRKDDELKSSIDINTPNEVDNLERERVDTSRSDDELKSSIQISTVTHFDNLPEKIQISPSSSIEISPSKSYFFTYEESSNPSVLDSLPESVVASTLGFFDAISSFLQYGSDTENSENLNEVDTTIENEKAADINFKNSISEKVNSEEVNNDDSNTKNSKSLENEQVISMDSDQKSVLEQNKNNEKQKEQTYSPNIYTHDDGTELDNKQKEQTSNSYTHDNDENELDSKIEDNFESYLFTENEEDELSTTKPQTEPVSNTDTYTTNAVIETNTNDDAMNNELDNSLPKIADEHNTEFNDSNTEYEHKKEESQNVWQEMTDQYNNLVKHYWSLALDSLPADVTVITHIILHSTFLSDRELLGFPVRRLFILAVLAFIYFIIVMIIHKRHVKETTATVNRISTAEKKAYQAEQVRESLEVEVEKNHRKIQRLEHRQMEEQNKFKSLQVDLSKLQTENKYLEETANSLQTQLERQKNSLNELSFNMADKDEMSSTLERKLQDSESIVMSLEKKSNELESRNCEILNDLEQKLEENQYLLQSKNQLLKEAEVWNERFKEFSDQLMLLQQSEKELQENLTYRENEIEALKDSLEELQILEKDFNIEDKNLSGDFQDKLKRLMDVSHVNAELRTVLEDRDSLYQKLQIEIETRKDLEDHLSSIKQEMDRLREGQVMAEQQCQEAQTKLSVLSNYFIEKEAQFQKELGVKVAQHQQSESKFLSADQKAALSEETMRNYKQQVDDLKNEITNVEKSFRTQLSVHEKKAHENWLAARTAEREMKQAKQEASMLRNKLTELERRRDLDSSLGLIKPQPTRIGRNEDLDNSGRHVDPVLSLLPPDVAPSPLINRDHAIRDSPHMFPLRPPGPPADWRFLPPDRPLPPAPFMPLHFERGLPPFPPHPHEILPPHLDRRLPPPPPPIDRRYSPPYDRVTPPRDHRSPPPHDRRVAMEGRMHPAGERGTTPPLPPYGRFGPLTPRGPPMGPPPPHLSGPRTPIPPLRPSLPDRREPPPPASYPRPGMSNVF